MDQLSSYIIAAENPVGHKQRRPILKRKRAGEVLTREQVIAIKKGRKLLRKQMRAQGLKEKSDFELTASNMGLFFDKHRLWMWLRWFFKGRGLWMLLAALALLLGTLFLYSTISQLKGHFTINMSDGMFKEGFVLSETVDFEDPQTNLFCTPATDVPETSISYLPTDLDTVDGQHNANYFAYTFYCRNEGESASSYIWQMSLNSESRNLASAAWVMIFEDGKMTFYARPNEETGEPEALPAKDNNRFGYLGENISGLMEQCEYPKEQYEHIKSVGHDSYYRIVPVSFTDDRVVATGEEVGVEPGEVHKYTVVIWLEGDDPDCTDELIGGHVGMEFDFRLIGEEEDSTQNDEDTHQSGWDAFWDNLKFWEG